jgi:hypothetical protein
VEVVVIIRNAVSRTCLVVLGLSLVASTSFAAPAGSGKPGKTWEAETTPLTVGVSKQLSSKANRKACLTFVVSNKIPTAMMLACAPAPEGRTQKWTFTEKGELKVSLSTQVGGDLPNGACLDTAADIATIPGGKTPLLVLPCDGRTGQQWTYNAETGALINKANGLALSSMIGLAKQAQPAATQPIAKSPAQKWRFRGLPPDDTLLDAIAKLLDALLEALGLEMPDEYDNAGEELLKAVEAQFNVPQQMQELPKQLVALTKKK